jgi:hypothetical protein
MRHVLGSIDRIGQPFPHRSTDRHVASLPDSGEGRMDIG